MTLMESLNEAGKREAVIDDCVQLVDDEVQKKSGMGGMAIKTGYKAVKGIRPGFIRKVVTELLDHWAESLDPIWQDAVASGAPTAHLEKNTSEVADALLKVTDDKADSAQHAVVRKFYGKLRPTAKKHVEEAVPGLGGILEKRLYEG